MCHVSFGPPYGIPITPEVHELYSDELKEAWATLNGWVQKNRAARTPLRLSEMPEEVRVAMTLIQVSPIPTYEDRDITGIDSCYMISMLADLQE